MKLSLGVFPIEDIAAILSGHPRGTMSREQLRDAILREKPSPERIQVAFQIMRDSGLIEKHAGRSWSVTYRGAKLARRIESVVGQPLDLHALLMMSSAVILGLLELRKEVEPFN